MSLIILKPTQASSTYEKASLIFKEMYSRVTGENIEITESDDGISDLIVIGSDAVNDFVLNEMLDLKISHFGIRYGTDDYCIYSHKSGNRNAIIFAGGRGRSTIYAIYDYFERYLDCHYFWDGDVIPHSNTIPLTDINFLESPRFDYRGLRYFAHRGLKRFQAEHWSFEDWKQELDWLVKKRLNFFMLRIGMDDVWQRAFPDDVPYPDKFRTITGADANGYDDRSDFWTLKYRGELRKKVLEYARTLDLMYPTDCGTMTHWYSRTPEEFLKKRNPSFAHQDCKQYIGSDTGKVWDFTDKDNMNNYIRLTETMVKEYEKSTGLFHTIGLGERMMYKDRNKNHAAKLIAYRRISENIREKYPDSKLMLASWDFIGWWTPEEVQSLVSELDPERTIILDYTSEVNDPNESFINWGVTNKFPWIFGLFHAYESENELRGPYDRSDERLKIAADDPFCKGLILWPELSHSDPLVLEYLTQNAWSPLEMNIEEITEKFCRMRYGKQSDRMNKSWQDILPFIKLGDWGGYSKRKPGDEKYTELCGHWYAHQDIWSRINIFLHDHFNAIPELVDYHLYKLSLTLPLTEKIISSIKNLTTNDFSNEFVLRDSIDITKTALSRFMNYIVIKALNSANDKKYISQLKIHYMELMRTMSELTSLIPDYSVYHSLKELQKVAPVNPDFEVTLKRNIYNHYCSQAAYELVTYPLTEHAELAFEQMINSDMSKAPDFRDEMKLIDDKFMKTPLSDMKPSVVYKPADVFARASEAIRCLAEIL